MSGCIDAATRSDRNCFFGIQLSFKSNTLKVFSGELLSKAALLLINLALIKHMAVDQYANYIFVFSMVTLGAQLSCAAIERLYIADYRNFGEHAANFLHFSLVVFAVGFIVFSYENLDAYQVLIALVGLWALALLQFKRIRFQRNERFGLFSLLDILKNVAWVILVVPVMLFFPDVLTANFVLVALFCSAVLALSFTPAVDASVRVGLPSLSGRSQLLRVLRESKSVHFYALVAAAFPYLPIIMASRLGGEVMVATYGAAMRYQALLSMCTYVLNVVFLPKISAASTREGAVLVLRQANRYIFAMIGGGVLISILIAVGIPFLDGGKYPAASEVFFVLAMTSVLSMVATPSINFLLAMKKYDGILAAMLAGFAVHILAMLVLVQLMPDSGIAYSALCGYGVVNGALVWQALVCRRNIEKSQGAV